MFRTSFFQIVTLCVFSLTAIAAPPANTPGPPDRYIVQVTEGSVPGQVGRGVAQRTGGKLVHVYTSAVKGFSIHVPPSRAKKDIEDQPGVLLVEPDVRVYAVADTIPTGVDRIDADQSGVTGPVDVDIAIIDTGIDRDHPDLNVVGGRHFYSLWGLVSFENDAYDDDNGHGTHCAGIAAAIDNGIGVVGVAPGARLWAVKVLDSSGSGYLSDVIAGIDWVTARSGTIEVANMSLAATASSSAFRTAVQNSVAAGIFYAVAAGNDSTDVYGSDGVFGTGDDVIPAAYPEAATISAMADSDGQPGGKGGSTSYGYDDSFASFSNYSASVAAGNPVTSPGMAIDLLMPGVDIYSCSMNGGYAIHSGTSMASPHAAGLAALYIDAYGRATDASGIYAIRQALIDAGVAQTDSLGLAHQNDPDPYEENVGWAGSIQTGPPSSESPMAAFVGNPTAGDAPLEVLFTDRSAGTITSWSWGFGDGGTSTAQNPSHTYTSDGAYTVSLTVSSTEGSDTETKIDYITVTTTAPEPELLVADFSGSPTSGDVPLTVHFTDLSSGDPISWAWEFGNGAISIEQNPSYTYSQPGNYEVTLVVANAALEIDFVIKSNYITVTGQAGNPPIANFSATPTSGEAPLEVQFTDLSTENPTSWSWDFGDGGTSTAQNPPHIYSSVGTYTVSLTVTGPGGSDGETKTNYITVTEPLPPPEHDSMHVDSITVTTINEDKGQKRGYATVSIVDNLGNPVVGVSVTGSFSEDIIDTDLMAATNSSGMAEFFTDGTAKGRFHITFCVTDVEDVDLLAPDFVYIPKDNVETCDSNY